MLKLFSESSTPSWILDCELPFAREGWIVSEKVTVLVLTVPSRLDDIGSSPVLLSRALLSLVVCERLDFAFLASFFFSFNILYFSDSWYMKF